MTKPKSITATKTPEWWVQEPQRRPSEPRRPPTKDESGTARAFTHEQITELCATAQAWLSSEDDLAATAQERLVESAPEMLEQLLAEIKELLGHLVAVIIVAEQRGDRLEEEGETPGDPAEMRLENARTAWRSLT